MPTVLHTADVHLTPDRPERTAALAELLTIAEREAVDVVTIGGDLFDRPEDVDTLRPELRNELFSDRPFRILVIPGNHDVGAFRGDVFFGDACTVMTGEPFEQRTVPETEEAVELEGEGDSPSDSGSDERTDQLRITGIPYRERPDDDLLLALQDRDPFAGTEILLLHCSLDAPFDSTDAGDEETRRYFPVTEDLLTELGFDYYLAGHYHSAHKVSLANDAEFTYPGTPASTRESETGPRRVSLLDPSTGIDFTTIETFHYASNRWTATPGSETELLEEIREWSDVHAIDSARASVRVDGFVETDEEVFSDRLQKAAAPATVTDNNIRGVQHVLSRPLFRLFEDELRDTDWDEETRARVRERTVDVFSTLVARGKI